MHSRLFRAVVGVGLALGASTTGCKSDANEGDIEPGQMEASTEGAIVADVNTAVPEAGAADVTTADAAWEAAPADASMADDAEEGATTVDAEADATTADRADARNPDAGDGDPFCDLTWPTTKGGMPACVDPLHLCPLTSTLPPISCMVDLGGGRCAWPRQFPRCVGGQWACPSGQLSLQDCLCTGDFCDAGTPGDVEVEASGDAQVEASGDAQVEASGDAAVE